jgi:lysophospholipase L1-like esterase
VTLGSWVQANGGANPLLITTGGDLFTATAGATPLAFLPTDTVDTFRLWYITNTGLGSFSYNVDGGTATTINENGSQVFNSVTIAAGSLGIHTLNLTWISGSVFVAGVEAYNSAIGSVQIINAGWAGATSANWVNNFPIQGNPWTPVPGVTTQAPDVILLSLGINDWRVTQTSTSVSTYVANVQALITAWKVNSDVILVTPAPSGISTVPLATQQQYVAALYSLAATNNLPIIDNFGRWGSFERMNPAPYLFYSSNNLHPNGNGYSDFAQSIASQLLSVVGH